MKKIVLVLSIAMSSCILQAALVDNLRTLTKELTTLQGSFSAKENNKPKEQEKPVPVVSLTTWDQLVQENRRREALSTAKEAELTVFNVYMSISADYPDMQNLQNEFKKLNPELTQKIQADPNTCGQFTDLHMTLLYLNIPVETSKVTNAENMKIEIKNQIVNWLEKQKAAIKPTVFEFAEDTKVLMGKNKDRSFITALFVPSQGTPSLRNTLLLPLAQALYPLYPYAWIGFLENPDYHISLLKLLSGCLTEKVIYPNPLPAVELFKFSSGKLKVSVSGANSWGMTSKIINW